MKTKALYIAAFMVIAASAAAVAKGEPSNAGMAVVPVKGSEVFKVIYRGESTSKVRLKVYNSSSDIVFTETFNNLDGFIRPLNFSGLEFGDYTIEVTDAQGTKVEKVNYQPLTSVRTVHVSKLVNEEGSFLLSVAKNDGDAITVKIYDGASNLLYTGSRAETGDFAQVFTLKDVYGGVTFEISDNAVAVLEMRLKDANPVIIVRVLHNLNIESDFGYSLIYPSPESEDYCNYLVFEKVGSSVDDDIRNKIQEFYNKANNE